MFEMLAQTIAYRESSKGSQNVRLVYGKDYPKGKCFMALEADEWADESALNPGPLRLYVGHTDANLNPSYEEWGMLNTSIHKSDLPTVADQIVEQMS